MSEQSYKIGAVSKLTGVPAVTIRMWERRHNAVEPARTPAGSRLYSRAEVDRVGLIKRAIDAGDSISTIANLATEEIQSRVEDVSAVPTTRDVPRGPLGCCVVGRTDFFRVEQVPNDGAVIECLRTDVLEDLGPNALPEPPSVDALLVQADVVTPELIRGLKIARNRLRATTTVVVYQFGSRAHLGLLDSIGIATLRGPVSTGAILKLCQSLLTHPEPISERAGIDQMVFAPIPGRRYTRADLGQLAQASSAVKCECPEHLAVLVEKLSAFEEYSAHCESENRADAAVHMMLHAVSANVRRSLEDALERVVEHEGIQVSELG